MPPLQQQMEASSAAVDVGAEDPHKRKPLESETDVLRLPADHYMNEIFNSSLRQRVEKSTDSIFRPQCNQEETLEISSSLTTATETSGESEAPILKPLLLPALRKPKRQRLQSWSSEGDAVPRMLQQGDHPEFFHDDEDEDDDDWLLRTRSNSFELLLPPPRKPVPRNNKTMTPAAMALAHGNALALQTNNTLEEPSTNKATPTLRRRVPTSSPRHNTNATPSPSSPTNRRMRPTKWLIPVNHPLKIMWDVLTVGLSIYNVYCTHAAIRDRQFATRPGWIEMWFLMDIVLNFVTQRTTHNGHVYANWQSVWGRYLTSWFVVDVLALFPGEVLYIQPVIDMQRKRKLWTKVFRRTKVATKVTTRILQSGHVPWVYRAIAKASARPIREIVKLTKVCIKYIPKYWQFVRQLKGWILVRVLRDWGHVRMAWRHTTKEEAATVDLTEDDGATAAYQDWEGLNEEEESYYDPRHDDDHEEDDDDIGPY